MPRLLLSVLLVTALGAAAHAQTEGVLQPESALERFVLRQHALGRLPTLDPGARPLLARRALALVDSAAQSGGLTAVDRRLADAYLGRAAAGLWGARAQAGTPLYPDGRSFARVTGDGYAIEAGPLVGLDAGPALVNRPAGSETVSGTAWRFSRGVRAAGHAGRVFAEARVLENQELAPLGTAALGTAPRQAYTVARQETNGATYDYLSSVGVVGYRDRFVEVRAGRDRVRLGVARGSLILSDYAAEHDHAQVRIDVGPVSGQAVYARLLDPAPRGANDLVVNEQRYAVVHRVAVRLGGGVELEGFEAVVFGDKDNDNRNGFEPAYLVPFALYRAVERDLGSPDNILLGAGAAWRVVPGARVYGQFVLDELTAGRFFEDAWTNKWGVLAGVQIADPRVPGLGRLRDTDLRIEYARLRPYLYSHRDSITAAVHFGDVLGHPAGPNASDLNVHLVHRPTRDTEAWADVSYTVRGRNTPDQNFGADPVRTNGDRVPEPNPTLQGIRQRVLLADVGMGLRLLPDLQLGLAVRALVVDDALAGRSGLVTPQATLRWGLTPLGPRY